MPGRAIALRPVIGHAEIPAAMIAANNGAEAAIPTVRPRAPHALRVHSAAADMSMTTRDAHRHCQ